MKLTLKSLVSEYQEFTEYISIAARLSQFSALPSPVAQSLAAQQAKIQEATWITGYPGLERSVITLDERPVGRLYLQRKSSGLWIVDITLAPEYQRKGIGGAVIDLVKEMAKEEPHMTVRAHVMKSNHGSRQMFEKAGFSTTADAGAYMEISWFPPSKLA